MADSGKQTEVPSGQTAPVAQRPAQGSGAAGDSGHRFHGRGGYRGGYHGGSGHRNRWQDRDHGSHGGQGRPQGNYHRNHPRHFGHMGVRPLRTGIIGVTNYPEGTPVQTVVDYIQGLMIGLQCKFLCLKGPDGQRVEPKKEVKEAPQEAVPEAETKAETKAAEKETEEGEGEAETKGETKAEEEGETPAALNPEAEKEGEAKAEEKPKTIPYHLDRVCVYM
ncbi:hypothetical protein KIPB_010300 [Kipferlia bialata]|uniref:Uncharacterized protein n=1 Tax=Kipferlia bialata TaxID=797122 RepID=A0A9K3GM93_9EUKA|nr:hypothetical protein KIPB_010300 [Kipferlia bialata]|eukprot:g10300.t1